jgi:threonine dehydrogenase-like Zn-dependent dehydrogenase
MQALTIRPQQANSAEVRNVPEPDPLSGTLLVQTLLVGVCGTDREIIAGSYGQAPAGADYLILGHESLGRVLESPPGTGFAAGDLVVGIVREPDPVPCVNCAAGEWDMCRNGLYTEHGIKGLHGFCAERYRIQPDHAVKLDPSLDDVGVLLEPTSVVAKAWDQIERIGQRSVWKPQRALITGAGPIGLLAAMIGVQRGLDVTVLDLATTGLKPRLVEELGATYTSDSVQNACRSADVVVECTGVGQLVFDMLRCTAAGSIICLTGISSGSREISANFADLNRSMVLENDVVFGSVNANRRHYELAAQALLKADKSWLGKLITRRVPIRDWRQILKRPQDDIKTVITFPAEP